MKYITLLLFLVSSLTAEDWRLRKDADGVRIYTRKTSESPVEQFRGTVHLSASVESVVSLIEDMESAPQWIHYCRLGKTLAKTPQGTYTYTITKLPWPMNDRDVVVLNKKSQDKSGIVTIDFTAAPEYIPNKENMVRISKLKGSWRLSPEKGGMVGVEYTVLSDPGGGISPWMTNMGIVDQPFKTLQNMKNMLNKQ